MRPAMPRHLLNEIGDFERVERLCEERICAVFLRLLIGAHQDYWSGRQVTRPNNLNECIATHAGEVQITEDDVRLLVWKPVQRFLCTGQKNGLQIAYVEDRAEQVTHGCVILHDQHRRTHKQPRFPVKAIGAGGSAQRLGSLPTPLSPGHVHPTRGIMVVTSRRLRSRLQKALRKGRVAVNEASLSLRHSRGQ